MDWVHLIQAWVVPPAATVAPGVYIAVALVAFLLTAVSKGGFGGGVGALSVPLLLCVCREPTFIIGMWVPILVVCDIATIHRYPREWQPSAVNRLVPGVLAGILLTSALLGGLHAAPNSACAKALDPALRLGIAAISVVFLFMQLRSPAAEESAPWQPTWTVSVPVGFVAGVTTTIAHAAGPVLTMYLLPQKMPQRVFVGTSGRYYFIFNALKLPFMLLAGIMNVQTLRYGAWLIPLAPLGVWFGAWLNRRVNGLWFLRIIQISLLLAAVKLGYDGIVAFL